MELQALEVIGFDRCSDHDFILYFSDDTYLAVTAAALAELFPERYAVNKTEEYGTSTDA